MWCMVGSPSFLRMPLWRCAMRMAASAFSCTAAVPMILLLVLMQGSLFILAKCCERMNADCLPGPCPACRAEMCLLFLNTVRDTSFGQASHAETTSSERLRLSDAAKGCLVPSLPLLKCLTCALTWWRCCVDPALGYGEGVL